MIELLLKQMGFDPKQAQEQFKNFMAHHNELVECLKRVEAKCDRLEAMIAAMAAEPDDGSLHDAMDVTNFPERKDAHNKELLSYVRNEPTHAIGTDYLAANPGADSRAYASDPG